MTVSFTSRRAAAALAFACAVALAAPAVFAMPQTPARSPAPAASTSQSASHKKKPTHRRRRHHYRREPTQKAPTADRISEIQSALARGGYFKGDPNGKWDANTVAAMQKFQSSQGLDPTGKIDALSLQKLGLGSDVAGVSAPKAPPPPSTAQPPSRPAASQPPSHAAPAAQPASKPQSQATPPSPPQPAAKPDSSASASATPHS